MNKALTIPEDLLMKHGEEVEAILRRAVRHALWRHKQLGQSVAVSRNGQVVILPPAEIPVDDEMTDHAHTEN